MKIGDLIKKNCCRYFLWRILHNGVLSLLSCYSSWLFRGRLPILTMWFSHEMVTLRIFYMVKAYHFKPKKCWQIYGCTYFRLTYVGLVFIAPSHAHDIIAVSVIKNTKHEDASRTKIFSVLLLMKNCSKYYKHNTI